jgi:hypothetical protein
MQSTAVRCHLCDRRMSLRRLESMEGEVHGVRVQIEGLPVLECSAGHRRFVAPDFPAKLMGALLEDKGLVPDNPASQRGRQRKRYGCPECGRSPEGCGNRHIEARRVLEVNGRDAFGVRIELPRFHCAACGSEYVPPGETVVDDLITASTHAFRSAAVSAS